MHTPLMLVDSYAQIYRGYYAIRALSNAGGEPTNAIFAMAKFLLKLQRDFPDCDGAFVFDQGKPPHRLALAPLYKANRPPMPEDLRAQTADIRALIDAFGWNSVQAQDWEADDLIAGITKIDPQRQCLIVSADKDLSQLIDDRVEMLVPDHDGKGLSKRGVQQVIDKFDVSPDQIVDYLALIGDTADNIPGIEGVGPKTAAALLHQFRSIEEMLARTGEISKEKLRTKIKSGRDLLLKNIQLVKLVDVLPDSLRLEENFFHRKPMDLDRIAEIASRAQLRSILRELESFGSFSVARPVVKSSRPAAPHTVAPSTVPPIPTEQDLFSLASETQDSSPDQMELHQPELLF